jgi:adenylate cyclase
VEGGPELAHLLWQSGRNRIAAANLVGASLLLVYFDVSSVPGGRGEGVVGDIVLYLLYVLVLTVLYRWAFTKRSALAWGWLQDDREPTKAERSAVLQVPAVLMQVNAAAWAFVAVTVAPLNYWSHHSIAFTARIVLGIALAGLAATFLVALLIERTMRPVFAIVLAGQPPERGRVVGIRRRLLLFWVLGSGIPLLGIALTPVALPPDQTRQIIAMTLLATIGLFTGAAFLIVAAASVADPVADVRAAMGHVAAGELDVEVPVDDDGELGLLQAGFNSMASGLRERERLRELFGGYVGEEVARHALEAGVSLEGEEREVSVLFVDVVGSTALAERRPAVDVVALLNRFFDAVVRVVDDADGWVNKFEGDAALCVFGAPVEQTDHAARALRAAIGLRDALRTIEGLDAGIGVSSGIAVAGNVGSERRYEYTVVGDPVNEAARLTDLAKVHPGRIVVSERTVDAAGPSAVGWCRSECLTLRGRTQPTQTFVPA